MKIKVKPSYKYKIRTEEEMNKFLHNKRKGSAVFKNKKKYNRKNKYGELYE